jgi:hypothetical protein
MTSHFRGLLPTSQLTSVACPPCARPLNIAFVILIFFSIIALPHPTLAAPCVGNYSSVTCGSNTFCCFNETNSCGNGSQPCCSGGKSCSASNIPNWSCSGQYACVAMSAVPTGVDAASYPAGLCANTCIAVTPTPTAAPVQDPLSCGICVSTESFVTEIYRQVQRREPDEGGLNYWIQQINSGRATRAQFLTSSCLGDEYKLLVNTTGVQSQACISGTLNCGC